MGLRIKSGDLNVDIEKYGFIYREQDKEVRDLLRGSKVLTKIQKEVIASRLTSDDLVDYTIDEYINGVSHIDKGMRKLSSLYDGGKMIAEYMRDGKHICLVTDFDSDGINSAATLYISLVEIMNYPKDKVSVIINRRKDGNGFTDTLIDRILELHSRKPIDLIIGADHGSSDEDRYPRLKEARIKLVITDHHQIPKDNYPITPDVFINPQREDSAYCKEVSGCFVAFLTMIATYKSYRNTNGPLNINKFRPVLPNVAISTITDSMSMKSPINRAIVKLGIKELNTLASKRWIAIKNVLGIKTAITDVDVGFKIGPLINSGNRVGNEYLVFQMLTATEHADAFKYCTELQKLNNMRKTGQKNILKQVRKDIDTTLYGHSVVMLIDTNLAINGVIASNVGDQEKVPTVCFNSIEGNDNILSGSGRGNVEGVNLLEIFKAVQQEDPNILVRFGGHHGAAGCAIYSDKYEDFKRLFNKHSKIQMESLDIEKKIYIDAHIQSHMIGPSLPRALGTISPYGNDWVKPTLLTKVKISYFNWYGNFIKVKLLTADGNELNGTMFNSASASFKEEDLKRWKENKSDVLLGFSVDLDSFFGGLDLVIRIIDMKEL